MEEQAKHARTRSHNASKGAAAGIRRELNGGETKAMA
jgi:hypothetical protein